MAKYFGTDGFRGEVNKDLTAVHAYEIGRFLGWYYGLRFLRSQNRGVRLWSHDQRIA